MVEIETQQLQAKVPEEYLPFEDTSELKPLEGIIGQESALKALEFGLRIKSKGFNVFVVGNPGTGRTSAVQSYLKRLALKEERPGDISFVHNFDDSYNPGALKLPAGMGREFNRRMEKVLELMERTLPGVLEKDPYASKASALEQEARSRKDELLLEVNRKVQKLGFLLQTTEQGFLPVPLKRGQKMKEEEYQKLPEEKKKELMEKKALVDGILGETFKILNKEDLLFEEESQRLTQDTLKAFLEEVFSDLRSFCQGTPALAKHLERFEEAFLENHTLFTGQEEKEGDADHRQELINNAFLNVVVDNTEAVGAPVINEDHPTYTNLIGKIEREAEMGTLITDFSLIKAGSLLRADGGYLIINAEEMLVNSYSWQALKRAVQSGFVQIEDLESHLGMATAKGVKPSSVPFRVKIILVGTPATYGALLEVDNDFMELFKVKAEFDTEMELNRKNVLEFAHFVSLIVSKEDLKPFTKGATAALVRYCSRIAGDQSKVTTNFGLVSEIVKEASFHASGTKVTETDLLVTLKHRRSRNDLTENKVFEAMEKKKYLISTRGKEKGAVNGLTVLSLGDTEFGRPVRITATVGLGKEGILDIEREADLSGPLHTKGILILSGFFTERFAQETPLSLNAKVVFEQTYSEVDGDSASAAELLAILSSLTGFSLRQDLAITGSINQKGGIQAIGGINSKIEGFFRLCKAHGLTGRQGVILPLSNLSELNLQEEVIQAVERKRFHLYGVEKIGEAAELLFGRAYEEIEARVHNRLKELHRKLDIEDR